MGNLYKFGKQKLNESELRNQLDEGLGKMVQVADDILGHFNNNELRDFLNETEKIPFKFSINQKMINLLNNRWDKKMSKEWAKSKIAIAENDLNFFSKQVSKDLKILPKFRKSIASLFQTASKAQDLGDDRYACEIFKYIERTIQESKEFYEEQRNYNLKYIDKELEI